MVNMFGDVLISAGLFAYLGAFVGKYRDELIIKFWAPFVKSTCIPCSKEFSLVDIIGVPIKVQNWVLNQLPSDKNSIENALVIMNSNRWPIIIDPQGQATKWIKMQVTKKPLIVSKLTNHDFLTVLENAIFTGAVLLLENVGDVLDPILDPILGRQVINEEGVDYIKIGDSLK
jgi:dynein heavy chain